VARAVVCRQRQGLVIGTTGLDERTTSRGRRGRDQGGGGDRGDYSVGAVLSRNSPPGGPYFDRVEIIELHHDKKVDAPSGTSIAAAKGIAAARRGRRFARDD